MNVFEAIVLGAVQGVTEFLPISSTAHLVLVPWFLGWPPHGLTFDIALHVGTLVALLIYFRRDWLYLAKTGLGYVTGKHSDPLVLYVIAASIPAGIAGFLLENFVETKLRDPRIIAVTLIVLAVVLAMAEKIGSKRKDLDRLSFLDAMTIGFAQAIAIIPGVSRSGVTMTAALFRGVRREAAARFSFYLSTPVIGGAVLKKLVDVARTGLPPGEAPSFITGIVVSGVVGYLSIKILLDYLQKHNMMVFVYYRIALGIVVYIAFWSGFR